MVRELWTLLDLVSSFNADPKLITHRDLSIPCIRKYVCESGEDKYDRQDDRYVEQEADIERLTRLIKFNDKTETPR